MKLFSDKHLYWLAWIFSGLALYFLLSAFYISSKGFRADSLNTGNEKVRFIEIQQHNPQQGEKPSSKPAGC